MKHYSIVDFKDVVESWYNELFPQLALSKSQYVRDADVIYVNSVQFDAAAMKDTVEFVMDKLSQLEGDGTKIVLQEPKAVNCARLRPMLDFVANSPKLVEENRTKIMHISNRRYIPLSDSVIISQFKEIDCFLDLAFKSLRDSPSLRFHSSSSLGMDDMIETAKSMFPRNVLNVQRITSFSESISVKSSAQMLQALSLSIMKNRPTDPNISNFLGRCKADFMKTLGNLL